MPAIRKNDFDLLICSDLELGSGSFKIKSIGPRIIVQYSITFHKDLTSSF